MQMYIYKCIKVIINAVMAEGVACRIWSLKALYLNPLMKELLWIDDDSDHEEKNHEKTQSDW